MAFNFEEIIALQDECFGSIKKLCVNYKKDGSERKTKNYLTTRLTALDSHWGEFELNNEKLMKQEDKSHAYYVNQVYEKTRLLVEDVRNDILGRLEKFAPEILPEPQASLKSNFDFDEISNTIHETPIGVKVQEMSGEKIQGLLKQQQCNFKAFERSASKINVDLITEKWELEDHLNILKTKWDIVDKTHWEIDYILQGSNSQYQNQYSTLETRYDNLKREINKKVWNSAHYEKTTPKMEIPDFSGNYTQWVSFKDLFTESVHSNPLLSKTQKMQLLKSKLKGEAEKLIQHLAISAENYDSCWEILQHRYNNERLLFTSYMNTLLNQQAIQQPNAFNIKKLHDVTLECLNGFTNIGLDITTWDPVIVHLISQKLDSATYGEYIRDLESPRDLPNLEEFIKFLETKFMAYETMQRNQNQKQYTTIKHSTYNHKYNNRTSSDALRSRFYNNYNAHRSTHYNKQEITPKTYCMTARMCPLCKTTGHVLMQCDKFLSMSSSGRNDTVSKLQLCKNCLYSHGNKLCFSKKACKDCQKPHHTLLHQNETPTMSTNYERSNTASNQGNRAVNNITNSGKDVLLATIKLRAKCIDGTYITLRAILDSGSQMNIICEDAAQRLRLPRQRINASFKSVGTINGKCKGVINLECKSLHSEDEFRVQPFIINKLINNLPSMSFSTQGWHYIENLQLADPDFNISGPIDMLLGADIYSELILDGLVKADNGYPIAQQTKMGWVLCGNVKTFNCHLTLIDLKQLTKFWESEEIPESAGVTSEEEFCENYYKQTTERQSDGKYVVKMPMKLDYKTNICNTRQQAISQFYQLEKKMKNNPDFATEYRKFMNDYITMGHMIPRKKTTEKLVYLPHHGVLKTESTTTKLRVVFNASYKSKGSNYSLNDLMYTGPNLQKDMCSLLINWRLYKYVFTADVEKMYRNIMLNEEQQCLQTIVWRDTPHEPLKEWQLTTVTYGTKAAPYLAMRTLRQLAEDEGQSFPAAANVLRNYCYMDDLVHGHENISDAKLLIHQLIELMKKGGFNLRKWSSNEPAVLNELKEEQKSLQRTINFNQDGTSTCSTKTLGIRWDPLKDTYLFNWQLPEIQRLTKRVLLSEISKLYDPMGWLSPTTIKAKLIFQKVWSIKLEWDELLPSEIIVEWENLRRDLPNVNKLSLRRWIHCNENHIEIHGFCDASDKAYACVVYSKTLSESGEPVITLLAAKTKVAPLKTKLTTPRMELCGAVLLSKLVRKIQDTFVNKKLKIVCWSDSQVVLAWLQGEATKWQSYVASRVTLIKKTLPDVIWCYVKSESNPADCASRGLSPSQLLNFKLWWEGPQFIQTYKENNLLQQERGLITDNELKAKCLAMQRDTETCTSVLLNLLHKYGALTHVIRVVAWLLRWINQFRNKNITMGDNLSLQEITKARKLIIRQVQENEFGEDLHHLRRTGTVSTKSRLLTLSPFLDKDGLLCVRGRLANSSLPAETKHPIILPSAGRLTELIIDEAHNRTLHGGARLTLANTRLRYWILGGNATIKKYLRRCVRCHRFKPHKNEQIMADLQSERLTPSRPFSSTGIDFTGHVDIKINKGRGVKTSKAYIAIFICMVTKAVHLELVSDLSTQTFIAAFRRMCSRRGTPKNVFTDNGTNFVGAEKLLRQEFEENGTFTSPELHKEMVDQQVNWKFNAPLWPSAGGLWEAAVKSMKYHLKRVLGEQKLTFEQFTTLLTEIEACMNSRPLSPLTEDPDDLDYLTPGHFLIGGPIISLPQRDEGANKIDNINRWKLLEHMKLQVWKRWSNEYLHQLQTRCKWQRTRKNLEIGDLVLIKEKNLPPGRWALGRVTDLHPGTDGHVRVVTLKTKGGYLKRPIIKLAPLPMNEYEQTTPTENPAQKQYLSTNATHSPETKESPPRRSNGNMKTGIKANCLTFLAMLFLTLTGVYCDTANYKIMNLQQDQPIYFNEIGNLQLIHDEWTILTYYNLTNYWKASQDIITYIDKIDSTCKRMNHTPCDAVVKQLRHESSHLTAYNALLLSQHMTRRRRGYFDGVGNLMRSMFGVLDSKFAEKYEKDIDALQLNDHHLLSLIRNQTLIVEAENNIIKSSEETMKQQFQTLHDYMNQVHSEISNIETRVQRLFSMSDVNSVSLTASLILNNLHRIQSTLLEALADVYRGHLDIRVFPASFIITQLNTISSKLPKGLSLPIKNIQQDIHNIYKLTFVKARITVNYMLFEIHIPLLTEEHFTLYRVIPIPFRTEGNWKLIRGTSKYIGINFAKDTFITANEDYLRNCIMIYEDGFICFLNQPIYHLQDKDAPCEAKIFSQHTSLTCVTDDVSCKDEWTQLHQVNIWLYTSCSNYLQRIVCGDQVTSVSFRGTGIIAIKPRCLLKVRDATIFSFNEFGSKSYYDIDIKDIDLSSTINNMVLKTWRNANLTLTNSNFSAVLSTNLAEIQDKLDLQKEHEYLPKSDLNNHDIYHYTISSLICVGALILAVYFTLKKCRRPRKRSKPQPAKPEPTGIELQEIKPHRSTPAPTKNHFDLTFD